MEESAAFPNAWNAGAKGDREKGKGQKGKGKGKGQKGQKGQKGKGRAGKAGMGSRESEDLPEERRRALMGELEALAQGTETGAVPRVGDRVLLQVLGKDRAELHGRLATVRGALPGAAAFTVRLEEGREGTEGTEGREVTASAEDLRVVEARASPLPETSLTFPKSLMGLERKFVHEAAEALGLVSQSFGQGPERYIAVFRPAQGAPVTGVPEAPEAAEAAEAAADADADVWISGVVLDEGSQDLLKSAVAVPDDWHVFADRCELCRGPLSNPKPLESANLKRSVTAEQSKELQRLRPAMPCELRVCTLARGNEGIAVGLLGLPTLDRNPHVLVAARGARRGAGERCLAGVRWEPWTGEALLLRGQLKQWHKAELSEEPGFEEGG